MRTGRPTPAMIAERDALHAQGLKKCSVCARALPLSAFGTTPTSQSADGLRAQCKTCNNVDFRRRYAHWQEQKIVTPQRRKHLRLRYGITHDQYLEMKRGQNSMCLICERVVDGVMHVDHDHATGKIRGLLCFSCNQGMGNFRDDARVLERAARYLLGTL